MQKQCKDLNDKFDTHKQEIKIHKLFNLFVLEIDMLKFYTRLCLLDSSREFFLIF